MYMSRTPDVFGFFVSLGIGTLIYICCVNRNNNSKDINENENSEDNNSILKKVASNKYKMEDVGVIKFGNEGLLYVEFSNYLKYKKIYSYVTGEFIDKVSEIMNFNGSYFVEYQKIPFVKCNPYVEYNYEMMSGFTDETLTNLEDSYFANHTFSSNEFKIYEILNITTNEIKYVIGKQVSGTQVFNFESYMVEDYTGYAIKDMEFTFEKGEYYYSEILELIRNYREENKGMLLERK